MSDLDGGAPASADSNSVPIETPVTPPAPISTEPVTAPEPAKAEPAEKKPEPTAREALRRAAEQVAKGDKADPKAAQKPEAKADPAPVKSDGPARADDGKFAHKEGAEPKAVEKTVQTDPKPAGTDTAKQPDNAAQPAAKPADTANATKSTYQAPARFSADAKTAWETAPEPVRAEVARMERELTEGYEKNKAAAKEYDAVRPFAEAAKQNGTTLPEVIKTYGKIETAFAANPIAGHIAAAEAAGHDFRKVAEAFLGRDHDQVAAQTEARVQQVSQFAQQLEAQNNQLRAELNRIINERAEQETRSTQQTVEAFAASKPRFEELRTTMSGLIKAGLATELDDAYAMADRLKPGPQAASPEPTPEPAPAPAFSPSAQTRKGEKSITGAPTPGSNPASRQPSSSIKESLRRALAQAG